MSETNRRVAIITGGSQGIGAGLVGGYRDRGWAVVASARTIKPSHDPDLLSLAGDITEPATAGWITDAALETFGRIDTLVNNAAGNFVARTEKLSANAFNAVVGIVLHGTFNCTQVLAKKWIAEKLGGNVLNIVTSYAAANCGSGFVVPSACAKAGVLAMTTSLAVEWAKYHIRVNAIAPGPFPTEGAWSRLMPSKQFEDHARESHPMKRFGRHEELTSLAVFLLSDMAEYINGECVVIDGANWLRGAGEFNDLLLLPDSAWEAMEAARAKKS
jgi:NAD(P)-dependent dehydrogenase (short-subunit alcohol dehydrogenase family)